MTTDGNGKPTTYSYDAAGNLTQISTPGGRTWQLSYYADSRVHSMAYLDGGVAYTTTFTYYPAANGAAGTRW